MQIKTFSALVKKILLNDSIQVLKKVHYKRIMIENSLKIGHIKRIIYTINIMGKKLVNLHSKYIQNSYIDVLFKKI